MFPAHYLRNTYDIQISLEGIDVSRIDFCARHCLVVVKIVEKVVSQEVQVPVEKLVQVPVETVVHAPCPPVEKMVEVEKVVGKVVNVPVEKVVERVVEGPVRVITVDKEVGSAAQKQTVKILQEQLHKAEDRVNMLEAQVKRVKAENDHKGLMLRKHGILDRSSNQSLKSLNPRTPADKTPEDSASSSSTTSRRRGYSPWAKQN